MVFDLRNSVHVQYIRATFEELCHKFGVFIGYWKEWSLNREAFGTYQGTVLGNQHANLENGRCVIVSV